VFERDTMAQENEFDVDKAEEDYLDQTLQIDLAELSDSSLEDDGDLIRTGNIPHKEWYENELHDGYDIDGKKVYSRGLHADHIDQFLASRDRKEYKRTIYDPMNDRVNRLNDRDLSIINRLRKGKCASKMYEPPIPPTYIFDITTKGIRPKAQFIISKDQYQRILKNVAKIKKGVLRVNKRGETKLSSKQKKEAELKRMDPYRYKRHMFMHRPYDVWQKHMEFQKRQIMRAPKERLPTNFESYNPSEEYLFSRREKEKLERTPMAERKGRIVPMKYECLRKVPQYDRFIHERFERCLDLYLLSRKTRKKSMVNPKDLLPKLPPISDLRPFPEILTMEFTNHAQSVRTIDVSHCGMWMASGSDDCTVRVFEVSTGREFYRHFFGAGNRVDSVQFNPWVNRQSLLSVVCKHRTFLIPLSFVSSTEEHDKFVLEPIRRMKRKSRSKAKEEEDLKDRMVVPRLGLKETLSLLSLDLMDELSHWPRMIAKMGEEMNWTVPDKFKEIARQIERHREQQKGRKAEEEKSRGEDGDGASSDDEESAEKLEMNTNDISIASRWSIVTLHSHKSNTIIGERFRLINNNVVCISTLNYVSGIRWHSAGDYFASFRPEKERSALMVHRFSRFESQIPFSKSIGSIQDMVWHPRKPFIYVACRQSIRCFNLQQCRLMEKYSITTNWISRLDLHRSGLNLIVGGMDGKVCWYDMDLSHAPFKTFNYHSPERKVNSVRGVGFHSNKKYQHLWATCGDDGKIFVFYCKMFTEKFADPILIPLKILQIKAHRFVDCRWHPTQPWIFAASSDGITRLYTAL